MCTGACIEFEKTGVHVTEIQDMDTLKYESLTSNWRLSGSGGWRMVVIRTCRRSAVATVGRTGRTARRSCRKDRSTGDCGGSPDGV